MIATAPFALATATLMLGGLLLASLRPDLIIRHSRSVLLSLAIVSLGALVALIRIAPLGFTIDVDPSSEPLIRENDAGIPIYEQAVKDFGSDDLYVIAMEVDDVFTSEHLETLHRLSRSLRGLPRVASVESLAHVLSVEYDAEREMVSVDRFMRRVPSESAAIEALRARALAHPIHRKTLISRDGRTAALNITFQPMTDAEFVALDLDGRIEALLAEQSASGRRFYVAGRPHTRSQAHRVIVSDLARLVPLAVVIAACSVFLMSGSLWGVLIPLLACLTATLWVFGAMAALQIDINLITLVTGPLLICVGSVYGVHVHARYRLIAMEIDDHRAAALECLRYARTPVLLAGFTTCIGFGALLLADIPATNELGAFSILGVASVTLISLTGVPSAIALLPVRWLASGHERPTLPIARAFDRALDHALPQIAHLAVKHSGPVLIVWGLVCVGALAAIPRITVDTDFIMFFLEDSRVRTDFAATNRLLTGVVPIYVTVGPGDETSEAEGEGFFRSPERLEQIASLQTALEALPGVREVLSGADFVRVANQALHGDAAAEHRIPETREAVAEAMFLIPKPTLRRFVTSNHGRANLIVRTDRSGSAAIRALEARIQEVLARWTPPDLVSEVIGNVILINRSADGIAGNQLTQVGLAAGAILALILAVFRSIRVAVLSMVPNVVPVLLFFGLLGLGSAPLSLPTSLIGSIALGIAIDDTMHFLVAYLRTRSEGLSPEEAAELCVRRVGRPIVMTSIMLVVGFLVIVSSGFATLREFGYLTALTMTICLCTDLLLLPALLVRLRA